MATFGRFKNFTTLALTLRAVWMREIVLESAVAPLFNMSDSGNPAERTRGLGNVGLVSEYKGSLNQVDLSEKDLKTFTHEEYADFIPIERKLLDDDQYNIVSQMLRAHATSYDRTVTYHMSAVFNNAFASSGKGAGAADGNPLCSTNSARNAGDADTRNKGTSALTHDAVVDTRKLMRQWANDKGLVIAANPDTLLVPVELESQAYEIVRSERRPDNANNAANFNQGLTVVVDPLLTDANNWFLIDSRKATMHNWWWWRQRPEFEVHPASTYDLELKTRGYMRYSFGADDHTWIYGHEVAAS